MNNTSNTNLTILLFEATSISASTLKDEYKHASKNYFNLWWKEGIRLWKGLRSEIKVQEFGKEGEEYYDETSAFLYEVARMLVDIDISKRDELIEILKEYGNKKDSII